MIVVPIDLALVTKGTWFAALLGGCSESTVIAYVASHVWLSGG